jgi:predicted SnoaL-like aldol condensation-catalyzing enzyme
MTSPQKAVLVAIAQRISAGQGEGLESLFTEDFRLHEPTAPDYPLGAAGVRRMVDGFAALGNDVELSVLDAVEEGDRVAVRWGVAWTRDGAPQQAAIIAIYRFADDGRIAEDWGVIARAPWP